MRNTTYRFLTLLCLFFFGISTLLAVPAYRGWQTVTQPDGSTITIRQMGDEFFHYWENEDEQQVAKDADGYWRVLDKPATQSKKQIKKQASRKYNTAPEKPQKVSGINLAPRGLVILVNFSDVSFRSENTQAAMSELMNSENYTYDGATGSVREFFKAQSGGAYVPNFDVVGPYTLASNRAHYGANDANGDDVLPGDMIVEACQAADADGVDFTLYNNNGDTYVDFVYVIYAGEGEADSDEENAIWPINWDLTSAKYYGNCTYEANQRKFDGLTVNSFACSGELRGRTTIRAGIGTICHEFSHVLGLPDYYVTLNNASNKGKKYDPGAWHLMDYGNYNNSGRTPPSYSPHDKYYFGWSTPTLLAKDAKQNCTLTTTFGSAYQITGGTTPKGATSSDCVWYLENRQKSGWDAYLPGHGMVVWEVTYNSADWTANGPNNENIGYTIVTANNLTKPYKPYVINTTASSTSGTPFPGTSNVTSWTPATGCELTEITESGGKITFKYNGGQEKWSYTLFGQDCTYPSDGEVNFNAPLSLTITPDAGFRLDDPSCWEVTMGGTPLVYGTGFTYTGTTFSIASVTGNVEILITGGHTVTWNVQGTPTTSVIADGAALVLPSNPADCSGSGGKKFVGWTASPSVTGSAPEDLFTSAGTKTVTSNITYYAVYATAGSGGGSSATYEFSITASDFSGSNYATNNGEHTSTAVDVDDNTNTLSVSWTSFNVANNTGMQWKKSGSYIYNSTDLGKINSVTVSGDALSQYYGTSEEPTNSTLGSSDGYFKVTNSTSGALHTTSITVNFTKTSGGTSYSDYSTTCAACTLTGITLNTSGATTTFTQGQAFTAEGLVVTASYSDCSDRTVSPTSVSSPDMSSTGSKTVTVTYTEGEVTKTKTYTITVNAAPTYTIRFFDGTTKLKEESLVAGATATPPSDPADCTDNGYTFVGWYTSKLADDNTTVTSGWITDFTVSTAQDYYAVYRHTDGTGSGITFSATGQGYSNGDEAGSKEISGVTFAFAKGTNTSNSPKFYTSSNCVHLYPNNTLTISSSTNITSLAFSTSRNDGWSANGGTWTASTSSWTGETTSVTFTVSSTTGSQVRISQIDVNGGSSGGTTYYTGTKDCTTPTEVTITFHKNDGSDATTSQTIDYNTATNLTANTFSREGYTFQGWATSASGEKVHNDQASVTLTQNTDLYAVWQKNNYNVVFTPSIANGSVTVNSQSTSPQSAAFESEVTVAVTPNSGYEFGSITVTNNSTSEVITTSGTGNTRTFTMPASNVTVNVTVNLIQTYTVNWYVAGTPTEETKIAGATLEGITAPDADDCDGTKVFMGWTATNNYSSDDAPDDLFTDPTTKTMPVGGTNYYAVFADQDGDGAKWVLTDLSAVTAGTYAIVNQTNHAFNGTVNSSGHGDCTSGTFSFTAGEATSAPEGTCEITIAVVTNGFSMYNASNGYLYASAASSGNLSWRDTEPYFWRYYNSNWSYGYYNAYLRSYNSVTGGIRTYGANNGDGVIKLAKKVGTASYSGYTTTCVIPTEVTVTFNANGGEGTMTPQVVDYNTATALTSNTFTREGYTFQGWATIAEGAKVYNDGASVTLKKNTTLYAVWSKNSYTITLVDPEHGSIETSPATTAEFGATVTVTVTPASGYVFGSITVTNDNTSATISTTGSGATQTFTMPASDVTITATVTPIPTYTVTWSKNGDESDKVSYTEGQSIVFPATATGCDGKTFMGWSTDPVPETDVPPTYTSSATMGTENLTFYAVYAEASSSGSGTPTELLSENFSSITNGNNTATDGSQTSWSGNTNIEYVSAAYQAGGAVRLGGGSSSGSIETKTLIASAGSTLTVSFSVKGWTTVEGSIRVTVTGCTPQVISYTATMSGSFENKSAEFTLLSDNPTVTIATTSKRAFIDNLVITSGGSTTYSGYTTTCGAGISAQNIGWITTAQGKKVKRVINVSAKNFDDATTLTATCANSNFHLTLGGSVVPAGSTGLTTTLTVEYTPNAENVTEPNVEIVLTAGDKTKTITVSGRSVPEDFLLITKKSGTWYALPANMTSGPGEYDGVEVSPNDATTPTAVAVSPSTLLYNLAPVATSRYAENGNLVRLVGNNDKCLWSNKATTTGKENIQNNAALGESNGDNYEWDLRTNDGIHYYVENPHHPHYAEGRRLAYGTKFGMYKTETEFFIVRAGCSSQPGEVNVSPRRVDATFSWISNTTAMHIDLYTNSEMTTGHLSATASSSPYVFYGLAETTSYWYKLTPGDDTDCAVTGTFKTTGPIIDIVEWQENGVVLFIDKGDINPVVVIDGQEEHGSITGGGNATELFFAKYFEGAGDMKLLSIFNGTKDDIPLTNYSIYIRMRGQGDGWAPTSDVTLNLSSLGTIAAGQEIIFFTRQGGTGDLATCSDPFFDDKVTHSSTAASNPRWVECDGSTFKKIGFNGNDPIMLKKSGTIIDIIGSQGAAATTKNCLTTDNEKGWAGTVRNMDYGKSPSDPAFDVFYEASTNHPVTTQDSIDLLDLFGINLVDKEISLTTARCIFFRDKRVISGDSAVLMNETTGTTFVTFTNHDEFTSEWYGRSVCMTADDRTAAGVTSDAQATCNSYQDIANMDYNDYYIDWTNIDPGQTLDNFTHDDETKEYTIPIDNMRQYACLNLRFQLQKNDDTHEVLTEAAQQVPIIVTGNKTTNDALFSELVIDKETHLPSYSHSVERCKKCNVVVLADATLTKADDADEKDVPQVSNVKVYPTGKLHVPSGTSYTVKSLSLRRQEDDVASAKIEGTLNVLTDDATYLDIRIDPTNWHYFTLPYDCNVSDIRFANEEETAIPQVGSDFLLCTYDGEHRAATKSTSWKDLTSTDVLKKGIGYIIAIPGDGKVQREFRFPMANTVLTEENDDKMIDDLHAWGGNDAELRPNHKGWNLIGNPYMMYYNLPTTTTPLAAGTLIHDPDEDPWMGHWVIEEGTGEDAGAGALYYIVVPQDNGWSEYKQTTIGGFDMPPFTSYFVQLGGNPDDNKGIEFVTTNKEDGPSPVIRRAPAEDIVDNHEVWFGVDLINADGESDETTLLMSDKFTNDYDMMRDLVKMRGTYYTYYTKPVLASRNNEGEMAFNALPDSTAAAGVPLNFYAATAGQYRFTVSAHYPLDGVKEAYLYDNDNTDAKWHNLLQEDYVFDAKKGDNTTRFMLAVKVERKQPEITTSIDNLHKGLVLTTVNRTLMLSGLTNDADIYVYDVSGKLLDARLHYSSESGIFRTTVNASGLYFVRVKTPDGQQTLETVVY